MAWPKLCFKYCSKQKLREGLQVHEVVLDRFYMLKICNTNVYLPNIRNSLFIKDSRILAFSLYNPPNSKFSIDARRI